MKAVKPMQPQERMQLAFHVKVESFITRAITFYIQVLIIWTQSVEEHMNTCY